MDGSSTGNHVIYNRSYKIISLAIFLLAGLFFKNTPNYFKSNREIAGIEPISC